MNLIQHHLKMIAYACSTIKRAEQRIKILNLLLQGNDVGGNVQVPPQTAVVSREMLERARQAVARAGYETIDLLAAEVPLQDADLVTPNAPVELHPEDDMRCIEQTESGHFRCNIRRGKRRDRLMPDVFETKDEARSARDALELILRSAIPPRRSRRSSRRSSLGCTSFRLPRGVVASMSLHDQMKHELRLVAGARSTIKKALEMLDLLVEGLDDLSNGGPPACGSGDDSTG